MLYESRKQSNQTTTVGGHCWEKNVTNVGTTEQSEGGILIYPSKCTQRNEM